MPGRGKRLVANKVAADLKRAESALRENEARFRTAFENKAIGKAQVALDWCWSTLLRRSVADPTYSV